MQQKTQNHGNHPQMQKSLAQQKKTYFGKGTQKTNTPFLTKWRKKFRGKGGGIPRQ